VDHEDEKPHLPPPSIWPVGFAIGIVCVLAGLVVSPPAVVVGVAITVVFGFLWARDAMTPERAPEAAGGPEPSTDAPPVPAHVGGPAMAEPEPGELEARFPRNKFLEYTTLGLGGVIGGIVTVPILGFAVLPAFTDEGDPRVNLGPLENFREGQWVLTTFLLNPEEGEVSRRTAFVRNNGTMDGQPSFTIISNRCVHLGCPVQAAGPPAGEEKSVEAASVQVSLTPILPANYTCPCHGGAYDIEGNRTAGPPVRALDRYRYSIVNGDLVLLQTYSVAEVEGEGANALIKAYGIQGPGEHVDGLSGWLYPLQPQDLD
jgi:menaquinol-cytochrome c reductase iron-sulfur subunit